MLSVWKRLASGVLAGAALVGAATHALAQATTTTITTTTTTTTTLQPHPFSPATASCVRDVEDALRACKRSGGTTCRKDFETDYSKCFAAGAGVSCAKRCVTRETTCLTVVPTTRKTCRKACRTALRRDIRACRQIADGDNVWAGGDGSCLTTAQGNLSLCRFVCSQATLDCHTSLTFCIANCANL